MSSLVVWVWVRIGLTHSERLVYAPVTDMTDQLVTSGEAQRQMEAVARVAQLSSSSSPAAGAGTGGDDDPLREEEEVEEMEANL